MQGIYLKLFVSEGRRHHGNLLYEWILQQAQAIGIPGGSAVRALAGFGRHGRLHEQHFFELAGEIPVLLEFFAADEDIERLLALLGISQSWLNHTRFAAAEWRRFLRIAVVVGGLVLALFLLRGGDLFVAGPNWDPTQGKSLATLNQMVAGVLVLGCVFSGLLCLHELRRSVRRLSRDRQTADSAS